MKSIIRRSRGYAPSPIHLKYSNRYSTLGLGAEENVNSCILLGDKAFISQYIGDVERVETLKFLEEATKHLLRITKGKISAVACDMHPKFITTKLAQKAKQVIAVELDDLLVEVLNKRLGEQGIKNVIVLNKDILKISIRDFLLPIAKKKSDARHLTSDFFFKYKIVANLPHNITSFFLRKFLSIRNKKRPFR